MFPKVYWQTSGNEPPYNVTSAGYASRVAGETHTGYLKRKVVELLYCWPSGLQHH